MTNDLVTRLMAFPGGAGAERLCREAADTIRRQADLLKRADDMLVTYSHVAGFVREAESFLDEAADLSGLIDEIRSCR